MTSAASEDTMGPKSPFEELRDDHAGLLRDMGDVQASVRRLAQPGTATLGAGGSTIRDALEMLQRQFRTHFRREEEGLFPEAQRMVSEGAEGADVFGRFFGEEAEDDMSAHAVLNKRAAEMLELAAQIEDAGGPDEASARRLLALADMTANLLERHAAKENKLILPMIEKSLTPEQVDKVRDRLQHLQVDRGLQASGDEGLTTLDAG